MREEMRIRKGIHEEVRIIRDDQRNMDTRVSFMTSRWPGHQSVEEEKKGY